MCGTHELMIWFALFYCDCVALCYGDVLCDVFTNECCEFLHFIVRCVRVRCDAVLLCSLIAVCYEVCCELVANDCSCFSDGLHCEVL